MTRWWLPLWLVAWSMVACTSAPPRPDPQTLLHDAAFTPLPQPIDAADIFALDDAMRRYLHDGGSSSVFRRNRAEWLVQSLYQRGALKIEYDGGVTRNAAQTFDGRAGNCMSLVVMTAALAKELGLQVEYNSAYTEETWSRHGSLLLRNGHVNITIGKRLIDRPRGHDAREWTVDFLPPGELQGLRVRPIEESTVVAMFMNNRAAEALARDDTNEAYWWARAGVKSDPGFAGVINTLGVVYLRSGQPEAAARVFNDLLHRQPNHIQALNNLALLYEQQGQFDRAAPLRARLGALEPEPPYHWFNQGQQALRRGDALAARDFFAREVKRADYSSEFHYWLAIAQYRLGEFDAAQQQLERAQALSTSSDERDLYAAKLAWLTQRTR